MNSMSPERPDPLTPKSPTSSMAPMAPMAPSPRRLLVVDDDRLVLATLVHGLVHAGFEVFDADNGDDAILLARQHRPEMALLDIRMDGMSGFDVAAYLRDHLHIPFMFLSAFNDEATLAQIHALGALAYLVKPLDVGQIVPVVEQAYAKALEAGQAPAPAATGVESAETVRPEAPELSAPDPLDDPVALAVGILMHRYSMTRRAALERLSRASAQEGRALKQTASAVVAAVEQLALPGGL